jgi:hypothetical protein
MNVVKFLNTVAEALDSAAELVDTYANVVSDVLDEAQSRVQDVINSLDEDEPQDFKEPLGGPKSLWQGRYEQLLMMLPKEGTNIHVLTNIVNRYGLDSNTARQSVKAMWDMYRDAPVSNDDRLNGLISMLRTNGYGTTADNFERNRTYFTSNTESLDGVIDYWKRTIDGAGM